MVALKIADAQGEIEVRAENGAAISWRRPGWAASISLKALRVDGGKVRLQVFLPAKTGGPRLSAEAVLAKGESLELSAASWAPPNLFGPGQAKARFICDE